MDMSGKLGIREYILTFCHKPKKTYLHELLAKTSFPEILGFLISLLQQKCMKKRQTHPLHLEIDKFQSRIKPGQKVHQLAQLNHNQLKLALIFIKNMLESMITQDPSTIVTLQYAFFGAGNGKSILINALTSIGVMADTTNAKCLIGFVTHPSSLAVQPIIHHMKIIRNPSTLPIIQRMKLAYSIIYQSHLDAGGTTIHKMQGDSTAINRLLKKVRCEMHNDEIRQFRDHHAIKYFKSLNGTNGYTLATKMASYRPRQDHSRWLYPLRLEYNFLLQADRRNLDFIPRTLYGVYRYIEKYVAN